MGFESDYFIYFPSEEEKCFLLGKIENPFGGYMENKNMKHIQKKVWDTRDFNRALGYSLQGDTNTSNDFIHLSSFLFRLFNILSSSMLGFSLY